MKLLLLALCVAFAFGDDSISFANIQYESCGGAIKVNSIAVDPFPIKLPGPVKVSVDVELPEELNGDLEFQLAIYKKALGFWAKVPCISGVGSCNYGDGCTRLQDVIKKAIAAATDGPCPKLLTQLGMTCEEAAKVAEQLRNGECPDIIKNQLGLPCVKQCPIPAMNVKINDLTVTIPELPTIIKLLLKGDMRIEVKLIDRNGGRVLGCGKVWFSIA